MPKLTDQYTWEEICTRVMNKINPINRSIFKKWFMEREHIGYLFDYFLISRAYNIWRQLQNQGDHFVVITGGEGYGKSTLAFQLATWVCPNFNIGNVCYNLQQYIEILKERGENFFTESYEREAVVIDEGGLDLFSREALSESNRILSKTVMVQRQLNLFVIICIPNFYLLDSTIRQHRVKTLIHVLGRGDYKAIVGNGIHTVVKDGTQTKQVNNVKLPLGSFWTGNFQKSFPPNLDRMEYEKNKLDNIMTFLRNIDYKSTSDPEVIQMNEVVKTLNVDRRTVLKLIENGQLEGRKLSNSNNSRWIINRNSLESYLKGSNPKECS